MSQANVIFKPCDTAQHEDKKSAQKNVIISSQNVKIIITVQNPSTFKSF